MTPNERQQFEHTQHALDAAREMLHTPQLLRRMGALASGMREVAMNARALPVVNGVVHHVRGYEPTEMIPVIGLLREQSVVNSMLTQTPQQQRNTQAIEPGRRVPQLQGFQDTLTLPVRAQAVTYAPGVMTTHWAYSGGQRTMAVQYDVARPIIGTLCDDAALGTRVLRLLHEFEHASNIIANPLQGGSASERSLSTELAAYGKEYWLSRGLVSPDSRMYTMAARVELYRDIYNGPIESDGAFTPNPQLVQRLVDDNFTHWFYNN